jgi:hypothetical protein
MFNTSVPPKDIVAGLTEILEIWASQLGLAQNELVLLKRLRSWSNLVKPANTYRVEPIFTSLYLIY